MSRTIFWRDPNGYPSIWMDEDEVLPVTVDWSDSLDDDDTISTHTSAGDGVTIDSDSNTTTTSTVMLSGLSWRKAKVTQTIVTADGWTKQKTIKVYKRAS